MFAVWLFLILSGMLQGLANGVNVLCMRNQELVNGVEVFEEDGRLVGVSTVAGKEVGALQGFFFVVLVGDF